MAKIPFDTSVQAEYEDGFILDETEQGDISAYIECPLVDGVPTGHNTFSDILNKRPEAEHGKMVRFSVFYKDQRLDFDWTTLPDNARPIRFRDRSSWLDGDGNTGVTDWQGCRAGYQYNDEQGKNHKHIEEL